MAHGFTITCLKCGSEEVTVITYDNGEFIEIEYQCDECGQVE
jgi:uncharacterized Zn finger protein